MNSEALAPPLTIPLDKEHGGIRLVVVVSFVIGWVASFMLLNLIIASEGINLLTVLISFGAGYGIAAVVEYVLKRRWPSGRVVEIDRSGVKLVRKGTLQQEMMSEDPVNVLMWSFTISKRARVPKGWSMLACALEYENQYIAIYTFMSPAQVEAFELASSFKKLLARRKDDDKMGAREDLRIAGEQRRLRDAEGHRWLSGAEMLPSDFIAYINQIRTQFPEWISAN